MSSVIDIPRTTIRKRPSLDNRVNVLRESSQAASRLHWLPKVFLISLLFPPEAQFSFGTFVLSAQRLVLLVSILPCTIQLLSGRVGRLQLCDVLVGFHAIWAFASFSVNHGIELAMKSGGIYSVEVFGAYLLSRVYIRDLKTFQQLVRFLLTIIMIEMLFAIPETLTGRHILREGLAKLVGRSFAEVTDVRMGLTRAFGSFPHPILYGVFCASAFSMTLYSMGQEVKSRFRQVIDALIVGLATVASVSSGAVLSLILQGGLMGWERATRRIPSRWIGLVIVLVTGVLALMVVSNRDPLSVMITYLTFNPATGYTRRVMWQYGSGDVIRNPFFGIGFNLWSRPPWLHLTSLDNFWLLVAIRHGIPGVASLLLACISALIQAGREARRNRMAASSISGWTFSMIGTCGAAFTVHLWGSGLTFFCFLLGAGGWMSPAASSLSESALVRVVRQRSVPIISTGSEA
jgi:O-Antigen ligase